MFQAHFHQSSKCVRRRTDAAYVDRAVSGSKTEVLALVGAVNAKLDSRVARLGSRRRQLAFCKHDKMPPWKYASTVNYV